jgi:hypothetical protein
VDGVSLLHGRSGSFRYDGVMGKNSPALFELIRDPGVNQKSIPSVKQPRSAGSHQPEEADIPVMRVEPKPRVTLSLAREVVEEPEPTQEAASPLPPSPFSAAKIKVHRLPQLRLTPTSLSIAVGGGLLLILIIWATAFKLGESRAERQAQRELELAGVRDPLKGDSIPLNPGLVTPDRTAGAIPGAGQGTKPPQPQPNKASQTPPVPPAPKPASPAPSSANPADTREIGLNYCVAASLLTKEQAERAAGFLRDNGVKAIAVLEAGAGASNNPDSWRVVVLEGITGQEYRDRGPIRNRVEADLTRLGEIYRRDPQGRVDFGRCAWEKKKE